MLQINKTHANVWQTNLPDEPHDLRLWRVVMRAAYRKTQGLTLYELPPAKQKKVLRCDVCEYGKRKQAVFADYETLTLLCSTHSIRFLYPADEEEDDTPIPWYDLQLCGCFG